MRTPSSYRNLFKYSLWFSISVGISAFISSSATEHDIFVILYRSLSICFHFFIISCSNILLMKRFEQWEYSTGKINKQIKQFMMGYIMTVILVSVFFAINYLLMRFEFISKISYDERFARITNSWQLFLFIPYTSLLLYSIVYFFHNFFLLNHLKSKREIEVAELKNLNSETKNQLLRQQIQPHFLFNALNTLKSLIRKDPELAEEYVIHLSEFLRASIADNRNQTSKVIDELKICRDYMNMQKIRFGEALNYIVELDIKDPRLQRQIPNFSLQPLLENAIKHNQFTLSNPLDIKVSLVNDYITVSNPIRLRKLVEHSTGNGLYNLSQRCKIIYNEDIRILNNEEHFEVQIKLI